MTDRFNVWFTSSFTSNGGTCVETMFTHTAVYTRDSSQRDGGTLEFDYEKWPIFVANLKDGAYDLR